MFRWSILYFSFFSLLIALIGGCGKKFSSNSEGVIEFEVTYPKMDPSHFMLDFLPNRWNNDLKTTLLLQNFRQVWVCFVLALL